MKHILLFCRRDLSHICPFSAVLPSIQKAIPFWHFYANEFFANTFGTGVRSCRSCLYLSSTTLPSTYLFPPSSDLVTPSFFPWLLPVFNTQSFSLFTTQHSTSFAQSPTFYPPFNEPRVYAFTNETASAPFSSQTGIYDPTHPVPEPDFTLAAGPFDSWFGIPFPSSLTFTHVRAPHPTGILTLYGLSVLSPLYPTILSSV